MESRTQGSRPRLRTQKNPRPRTAFPRTDTLEAKDRNARGQGPRTQAQVLSKKKKKGLHKNFSGDLQNKKKRSSQKFFKRSPQKNVFQNIFQALHKILTIQKILLSSSRGQANFRGLEAKAKDLTFEAKAKDFQNVSSRTSSRPRTSSRTPPLLILILILKIKITQKM